MQVSGENKAKHTWDSGIAGALAMSDDTWKRHANPWSVWTRIATCLPMFAVAVWSRDWIGWWSVVPIVASVLWIWLNPRVFPPPQSTDNWASYGVFGERVWLNRKNIPIPAHHRIAPNILSGIGGIGLVAFAYGLWQLQLYPTLIGVILMYAGKLWYFDRMAWLYREMKDTVPEYASWYSTCDVCHAEDAQRRNSCP